MNDVTKTKGVAYNTADPIEKYMYEHADKLKKQKRSYSALMKNLHLAYLISIGDLPPGLDFSNLAVNINVPLVKKEEVEEDKGELENADKKGILKAQFSLDDDE